MAFVLTLAFVNGCATVISKMINYRCTKILGTNNGSLVNYVVASVVSFLLLLVSSRFHIDFYSFVQAPWWMYLGGAFGILAFIISMMCIRDSCGAWQRGQEQSSGMSHSERRLTGRIFFP